MSFQKRYEIFRHDVVNRLKKHRNIKMEITKLKLQKITSRISKKVVPSNFRKTVRRKTKQ